jgi:hypothetical protein
MLYIWIVSLFYTCTKMSVEKFSRLVLIGYSFDRHILLSIEQRKRKLSNIKYAYRQDGDELRV